MTDASEEYFSYLREAGQNILVASVEAQELNAVSTLGLTPFKDGNEWCVLWGQDMQSGIVGFGSTPMKAINAFNKALHAKEPSQ